jgi:predicted enzyme related to lactoylglutathione lyase
VKITEIAFSSYPVTDIPRARAFYEGILRLNVTSETNMGGQGHWIEYDIGPGTLGIGRSPGWKPTPDGCTVALEVADFEEAVSAFNAASVPVKMGPIETPVCRMIMISDPDGNTIIIHKRKPGHH